MKDADLCIRKGDHAGAIKHFKMIQKEMPRRPLVWLNSAITYQLWGGHCREGIDGFKHYFAECKHCQGSYCNKECNPILKDNMRKRMNTFKESCSGKIDIESSPNGLNVYINSKLKGTTPIHLSLVEGSHQIRVDCPKPDERPIQITAGKRKEIDFNCPTPASLPVAPVPPDPIPPLSAEGCSGLCPWIWISGGLAAAGLVGAGFFGYQYRVAYKDAESIERRDDPDYHDAYDRSANNMTWGIAAGVFSGLALTAGLIIYNLEEPSKESALTPNGLLFRF